MLKASRSLLLLGSPTLMRSHPIVVCYPFIGDGLGGSHISAVKLIEALDPKVVAPVVALHITDGPLAAYLASRGVPFVEAPGGLFPGRGSAASAAGRMAVYMFHTAAPISRFLKAGRVDLVHTNDGRIHVAWALPARLAGARHV